MVCPWQGGSFCFADFSFCFYLLALRIIFLSSFNFLLALFLCSVFALSSCMTIFWSSFSFLFVGELFLCSVFFRFSCIEKHSFRSFFLLWRYFPAPFSF